jgi:cyclic pyranopterin phosphate synthase
MVDVSGKPPTLREAVARGRIRIAPSALRLLRAGRLRKGGVIEAARLAGILAAKRTGEVIPLCHPLPLTHVDVDLLPRRDGFTIEARVRTEARTGAEMEALHAVAVADRTMAITDIVLVKKTGGKSGDYRRR